MSLTKMLANRAPVVFAQEANDQLLQDFYSLESATVDESINVDGDLEDLHAHSAELATNAAEIAEHNNVNASVDILVDETIAAYGENGITEDGAELMKMSVECLLRAAGLNVDASTIVPSFEAGKSRIQYSIEADEKKGNVLQRMWDWFITALKSMVISVKTWWMKLRNSTASIEKYINSVKEKVSKLSGVPKVDMLKVSESVGMYLTTHTGTVGAIYALKDAMSLYQHFLNAIDTDFGKASKIKAPDFNNQADVNRFNAELQGVGGFRTMPPNVANVAFIPAWKWTIEIGRFTKAGDYGHTPMAGAKGKIVRNTELKIPKEVATLSLPEIHTLIQSSETALAAVKGVEKKVEDWIKNSEKLVGVWKRDDDVRTWQADKHRLIKDIISGRGQKYSGPMVEELDRNAAEFNRRNHANVKALLAVNTMYGQSMTSTLPYVLQQIRVCVGFAETSSKHFGVAEMKSVAPQHQHRIGHDDHAEVVE